MPPKSSHGAIAIKRAALSQQAPAERLVASNKRTIQVWESAYNANEQDKYHWDFQIAKSVDNGNGSPTFNVVWQSKSIAPSTLIVWEDVYALNWTAVVPAPGVRVTISGVWQPCQLGESYDLTSEGFWTPSTATPVANFMNVGKVLYKYPNVDGIHIVIGVQNSSGDFDIIYVDPTALPPNSSAKYQPKEIVEWWYQADNQTAAMISTASTAIATLDFSGPAPTTQKYYYSTTFNYDSGTWIISSDTPPQSLYAPPQKLLDINQVPLGLFSIWTAILEVVFQSALDQTQQAKASASLGALLRVKYKDVEVKVIDSLTIDVSIGALKRARPHSNDAVGAVTDDLIAEVSDLLQFEVDDGDLPSGEGWSIEKIQAMRA